MNLHGSHSANHGCSGHRGVRQSREVNKVLRHGDVWTTSVCTSLGPLDGGRRTIVSRFHKQEVPPPDLIAASPGTASLHSMYTPEKGAFAIHFTLPRAVGATPALGLIGALNSSQAEIFCSVLLPCIA